MCTIPWIIMFDRVSRIASNPFTHFHYWKPKFSCVPSNFPVSSITTHRKYVPDSYTLFSCRVLAHMKKVVSSSVCSSSLLLTSILSLIWMYSLLIKLNSVWAFVCICSFFLGFTCRHSTYHVNVSSTSYTMIYNLVYAYVYITEFEIC